MPRMTIHTSTILLLARLVSPEGVRIIVYDPDRRLVADELADFCIKGSLAGLEDLIRESGRAKTCLFNLSGDLLPEGMPDWLVEFGCRHEYASMARINWNTIHSADGSPRWIYPSTMGEPHFLALYNFTYWKARLFKFLVRLAFSLRMRDFVRDGFIVIHSRQARFVESLILPSARTEKNYAIFTGTPGPNRKAVVAEVRNGSVESFLKIALNERSAKNIKNEYKYLSLLGKIPMQGTVIPRSSQISEYCIRVSNVRPDKPHAQREFGRLHCQFLRDLYNSSVAEQPYGQMEIGRDTGERLSRLGSHPRLKVRGDAQRLFLKLKTLQRKLQANDPMVLTSICHGDFTPWNSYCGANTLFVYDWEFTRRGMPLLFDFFHFVVQAKVFGENASTETIRNGLDTLLASPCMTEFLAERKLDPALYLQLYLLFNASYYLEVYLEQDILHKEAYRLFTIWSELLGDTTGTSREEPLRSVFIREFFDFLQDKEYVVLKGAGKSMQDLSLSSDIDLLIGRQERKEIMSWIRSYPGIQKLLSSARSFMSTQQIFFNDNSFLSIDLLLAFHRKSLQYIPAKEMLVHAQLLNGIRVLPPAYDYLYIYLFYQLNFSEVPEKYSACYQGCEGEQEKAILELLKKKTGLRADRLSATFARSPADRRNVISFLRRRAVNLPPFRLIRWIRYLANTATDLFSTKGIMLTFSGVDGAGKSTILGEIRDMLQQKYRRKVVVLRHRPSILPILSAWKYGKEEAENKVISSLPRKGTNKNRLSSLARFAYYYTDYLLGQFLIYAKYMLRGYVVLYDRYYFDFIVDGRRSNIDINQSFIRQLYRFVYKPQLNVFLYAPPEVILLRKQEMSAEDITELTQNYRALFHRLGGQRQYICIENMNKQETIDRIEQAFIYLN